MLRTARRYTLAALAVAAATGFVSAGQPVAADEAQGGGVRSAPDTNAATTEPDFTEQELRSFVIASLRLDHLITTTETSGGSGDFEARAREVIAQTQGIDRDLYQKIAQAVWRSEPLRTRLRQTMARLQTQDRVAAVTAKRD